MSDDEAWREIPGEAERRRRLVQEDIERQFANVRQRTRELTNMRSQRRRVDEDA